MHRHGNVIYVCNEHAPKPDPRYSKLAPEHFVGKHVKKGFPGVTPDGSTRLEHMWVKIKRVEDGVLIGKLDNVPTYKMDLKCGDEVKVALTEIEQVIH